MRELSIEEKAKAYDKALEKLRDFYRDYDTVSCLIDVKEELANIFPELKESEDEKIRKDIIFYIKAIANNENISPDSKKECKTWIAWLEKQGEQKPVWSEEDEHRIKLLEALCEDKLFESVPNSTMYEEMKITIDWLNSLRPKPKQEWNREDENMIGRIRSIVEKYAFSQSAVDVNGELCEKEYIEADNWLKSLKEKYTWKPSIAQLNALSIVSKGNAPDDIEAIVSLYNNLKKLTE